MNLKLIGADTSNGIKIMKIIRKVQKDLNCEIDVTEVLCNEKEKYNIKIIPTLLLNDIPITSGNVISEKELYKIMKPMLA